MTIVAQKSAYIVEDSFDTCEFMRNALISAGYIVRTSMTRDEALVRIRQHMPDVLIVDWAMPGMDAYTFMREVWRAAPMMPVIFVSAYDDGERVAKRLGLKFLRKPFDAESLQEAVSSCFGWE